MYLCKTFSVLTAPKALCRETLQISLIAGMNSEQDTNSNACISFKCPLLNTLSFWIIYGELANCLFTDQMRLLPKLLIGFHTV